MATGTHIECGACDQITPVDHPVRGQECPHCGDDWTTVVSVTPCGAEHPADCGSEDHHFGIHQHVKEVS